MLKQEKAISFNSFFIIEFMRKVLEKARTRFTPHVVEILEDLANSLKQADDPILILEKLARYQETNDMSIFLFDMLDRVEKIPPQQTMDNLDGLSDDFINLYTLMIEDSEIMTALEVLTNEFKQARQKPAAQAKPPEEQAAPVSDLTETEAIPFDEFYRQEAKLQLLAALPEEDRNDFTTFLKVALQEDAEPEAFEAPLSELLTLLREIFPQETEAVSAETLMKRLPENAQRTAKRFITLKEEQPDMLRQIIETGALPRKPVPEEKGEVTIDTLLQEYFRSEVDDHIQLVRQTLSKPFSEKAFKDLITYFKSLKEVSMIHGYTSVEYLCERIMGILREHENDLRSFSPNFVQAMEKIMEELHSLEHFDYNVHDQKLKEQVDYLTGLLRKAITAEEVAEEAAPEPAEAPEEEATAEEPPTVEIPQEETEAPAEKAPQEVTAESPVEAVIAEEAEKKGDEAEQTEPLLSLEDRPQLLQMFKELLEKLEHDLHPFAAEADWQKFLSALQAITKSADWLEAKINELFFDPFLTVYENIFQNRKLKKEEALTALARGWQDFLQELTPESTFSATKEFWKNFNFDDYVTEEKTPIFGITDGQTLKALAEAMQKYWQFLAPRLPQAVSERDVQAVEAVRRFIDLLNTNLKDLKLDAYLSLPAFFKEQFIDREKRVGNNILVDEIRQAFDLFFERLAEKGREGDSKDLADVLNEVLAEEASLAETKETPEAAEDEQDFINDSLAHLQKAQNFVNQLRQTPEKREWFGAIAGEVHAVYSAAQFMNHEKIADAAIIVEEAAEMFATPEVSLPGELLNRLEQALTALSEMVRKPGAENQEPFKALQSVLDQLVMEEPAVDRAVSKEAAEEPSKTVEEKPLFSPEVTDEAELREIFKEDAHNLLAALFKANQALLRNPVDEDAIREFDQAVHSLKNAARMTGLDDLSLIFGRFEEISEQLKEHSSLSTKVLQEKIADVLHKLEPLILKGELDAGDLDSMLSVMDELAANLISAQKGEEERTKRLRSLFVDEAKELIEKINHDLIELEKVPESATILAELLRHLHTLKGGAMMANFNKIGELAHKLEDYFQLYRDRNAETKLELLPTAFTIIDLISEMVRSVEQGKPEIVSEFTARLADIDNKLFYLKDFEFPREFKQPETVSPVKEPLAVQEADNTIKIKSSFVDHLVNLATEMVVNRTELLSYFEMLKKITADLEHRKKDVRHFTHQFEDFLEESAFSDLKNLPPSLEQDYEMLSKFMDNLKNVSGDVSQISTELSKLVRSLEKNVNQLSVLSKSLHGDLLKARMLPIRLLFERFERPVRDLARKQRKQIELVIEDNGAELDRAMVDALYEPLLHIIRNAVDHGIEKPAQRKKLGKDPKGKIILRARQEKSQVVIDIIDDGQGIDPEKIRQKIIDSKMLKKREAQKLSESRLLEYIFAPDFSTSDKTTDVSGRGIGLDVVVSEIQKLKGIVRVKTNINQGTVFSIRVPLTLIVSQAMLVKFREQTLAIPLIAVMESIEIGEEDIMLDDQRAYIQVRGKLLPYVDIDSVLHLPDEEPAAAKPKNLAVILHDSGVSIALGIEEIKGRQDIVIKNLGSLLQNVELINGGTILTNGEVALILDYASLIHKVETEFFGASREKQLVRKIISSKKESELQQAEGFIDQGEISPKVITNRQPVVMVVDDAMSVREFISSFLERNGFKTLKAANGKEALKIVKKKPVDLLITDLEMPEMHGFDLIKKLRNMAQYKNLPIIILTAQAGKNFQTKGAETGANAFISKPFKEGELLRMINAFIKTQDGI